MLKKTRVFAVLVAANLMTLSAPAVAEEAKAGDNAEQRINLSGKLRMLSQRIPAAACHLSKNQSSETAKAILQDASAEFTAILNALEFGDPALNVAKPENRQKTLAQIADLKEKWAPMKEAAMATVGGSATDAQRDYIFNQNMTVLGAAVLLVSELSDQYSNPNAVSQANLMLVDISGRQRMLTQKMSKETCLVGTAHATPTMVEDMTQTMQVFEASLEALKFGMPAVGIAPPPNGGISEALEVVATDWQKVKPLLVEVANGGALNEEQSIFKFEQLNTTMASMNKAVGLYVAAVKPKNAQLN
ncbi:MAG: type IV pili methyl-accepting chemotaxis transducer N-terminal domain-containing protein [Pseudomonadota bacterium]